MSADLKKLEAAIVSDILDITRNMEDLDIERRVHNLTEEIDTVVAKHFMKSDSMSRGLIIWLKPGTVIDKIKPKILLLKETLQFLLSNSEKGSFCYDLLDKNIDSQYDFIKSLMSNNMLFKSFPDNNSLDLNKLRQVYKDQGFPEFVKPVEVSGVSDIMAVASKIFDDLADSNMHVNELTAGGW